jgi:hypothetical protein
MRELSPECNPHTLTFIVAESRVAADLNAQLAVDHKTGMRVNWTLKRFTSAVKQGSGNTTVALRECKRGNARRTHIEGMAE